MATHASSDATATRKKADSPSRILRGFSGKGDIGAPSSYSQASNPPRRKTRAAARFRAAGATGSTPSSSAVDPPRGKTRAAARFRAAGATGSGAPSSSTVQPSSPRGRTSASGSRRPSSGPISSESSYMQAAPPPPPAEESPEPYQYGASIPGPYPSGGPAPPLPEREPGLPPDSRAIFTDRRVPVGYNFGPPGGGYRGDPYQSPAYQPYPPVDPSIQTQEEQGNFAVEGVPSYGRQQDLRDRLRSRIGL